MAPRSTTRSPSSRDSGSLGDGGSGKIVAIETATLTTDETPSAPAETGGLPRGLVLTTASQVLSALTNFLPALVVARSLTSDEFGAFSLATTVAVLVLLLFRSLYGEPFLLRIERLGLERNRGRRHALASSLHFALPIAVVTVVVAAVLHGTTRTSLVAMGLLLIAVVAQDCVRYIAFALQRPMVAVVADATWLVSTLALLLVLVGVDQLTAATATAAWAAGAAPGAVAGAVMLRAGLSFRSGGVHRITRPLGLHFAAQTLAMQGASLVAFFGLGALVGLDAAASIRGVQLLYAPLNVLFLGAATVLLPHMRGRDLLEVRRTAYIASGALTVVCGVLTGLLLILPASIGEALLGSTWNGVKPLILIFGAFMATQTLAAGPTSGLKVLEANRLLTLTRVVAVPFVIAVPILFAGLWDAEGFAAGLALTSLVTCIWWWIAMFRFQATVGRSVPDILVQLLALEEAPFPLGEP